MAESKLTSEAMLGTRGAKDRWFIDPGPRGAGRLIGRITPAGERRFYYRYTNSRGERIRLSIGPFDPRGDGEATFTLKQARLRVQAWQALYSTGIRDLREHLAQARADADEAAARVRREVEQREQAEALERDRRITVRALFDRWCAVDLRPQLGADGRRTGRKDGGQYTREQFERHVFPAIGDQAAVDVRKADAMAILDGLKAAGKLRTTNVLLADMKQMFAFALAREIVERNPLDTVTRRNAGGTETMRERVLSPTEIASLGHQVRTAGLNRRTAAGIWLLLATGARIGELMGAVWAGAGRDLASLAALPEADGVKVGVVDLVAATWHLPTTKNERDHTIHLSAFALRQFEVLATLQERDADGKLVPWVFPNTASTGPVCVKSFGKQLVDRQRPAERRMSGRSKNTTALSLPGGRWTAHDLRRTAGTLMASLGVSGDVIDECLNHVIESRVRRTYIRDRRPLEQARAFDALGARLEAIVSGARASSNVVALHAA